MDNNKKQKPSFFKKFITFSIVSGILGIATLVCFMVNLSINIDNKFFYNRDTLALYNSTEYQKNNSSLVIRYQDSSTGVEVICSKPENNSIMTVGPSDLTIKATYIGNKNTHSYSFGGTWLNSVTKDYSFVNVEYKKNYRSVSVLCKYKNGSYTWSGECEEAKRILEKNIEPAVNSFFSSKGFNNTLSDFLQDKIDAGLKYTRAQKGSKIAAWILFGFWILLSLITLIMLISANIKRKRYNEQEYINTNGIHLIKRNVGLANSKTKVFSFKEYSYVYNSSIVWIKDVKSTGFSIDLFRKEQEDKTFYFKLGLVSAITGVGVLSDFGPQYKYSYVFKVHYQINLINGGVVNKDFYYEIKKENTKDDNVNLISKSIAAISSLKDIDADIFKILGRNSGITQQLEQAEIGMKNILKGYK